MARRAFCAAMLWEMIEMGDRIPHVTVLAGGGRSNRKGLLVHRARSLGSDAITVHRGIPVTTPVRTLEDIDGAEPRYLVRKARRQAEYLGLPRRSGSGHVDFSWPGDRFALETDAWTGHRGREQMESDAALGLELAEHGYELVRLTARQLKENRAEIARLLRRRLGPAAGRS